MTKLFALIAAFGLVAAPAFAVEEHKGAEKAAVVKTEKTIEMKSEAKVETKCTEGDKDCLAKEAAAMEKAKLAPAGHAVETKIETKTEKTNH